MSEINEEYLKTLRKLQELQLMIAKEVDGLCREHNINYVMTGGTLLGAIRHKGFIPWDDDLDIAMPRKDYERFLEVCKKELSDKYFLQNTETDPKYGFLYAKVQLKGTTFLERNAEKSGAASGIFIDIFPLEFLPKDKKLQKSLWRKLKFYKTLLLCKSKYRFAGKKSLIKTAGYFCIKCYSLVVSKKAIIKKLNKIISQINVAETDTYTNLFGAYSLEKEIYSKKDIDNSKDICFEDTVFRGPEIPENFLENLYGDFMRLPPEDKRYNRHGALKISFGDYAETYN